METFHHPHSPLATMTSHHWEKLRGFKSLKPHSNPRSVLLLPVEDRPAQAVLGPTAHCHQHSKSPEQPLAQCWNHLQQGLDDLKIHHHHPEGLDQQQHHHHQEDFRLQVGHPSRPHRHLSALHLHPLVGQLPSGNLHQAILTVNF